MPIRLFRSTVLKGGTTLSKVFGIIERLSEDMDLVLDWRLLGFGKGLENPYQDFGSNTKQDQFNKRFNEKAAQYIAGELLRRLSSISIFAVVARGHAKYERHWHSKSGNPGLRYVKEGHGWRSRLV